MNLRAKRKVKLTFIVVASFLVAARMLLPSIVLNIANKGLSKESPNFTFKIADIDLKIWKGHYVAKSIHGFLKSSGEKILSIESVEASVSWGNLLKGRIVTDVDITNLNLVASQSLFDNIKTETERLKEKYQIKEDEIGEDSKIIVSSFRLHDSNIKIQDFLTFQGKETREISDLNLTARNIPPSENDPNTSFQMTAKVFGPAPLNIEGSARLKETPIAWDANLELKNFDLTTVNPIVQNKIKAYIETGMLDDYTELKSFHGVIEGYSKPFISKLRMETPEGGFNFTGEAAKLGGNLVETLLKDAETQTLATKIPFKFNEGLEVDIMAALTKAVEHKVKDNIKPGIEDEVGLDLKQPRQAQELDQE